MVSPVVICHQLRGAENLAAIARVMSNFGFDQLVLSDPQTHEFRAAGHIAVKAEGVLEKFAIAQTLDEALATVVYAVGTTSRTTLKRFTPLTPEQAVAKLAEHSARGKVALVLGGEKRGLSDDELARCHDVLVIPTPGPQPSMNLSHATGVLLYLCSRQALPLPLPAEAGRGAGVRGPDVRTSPSPGAARHPLPAEQGEGTGAELQLVGRLESKMKDVLLRAEFLNPQAPEHVLGEMLRGLVRKGLTDREARLWLAAFEHLDRHVT